MIHVVTEAVDGTVIEITQEQAETLIADEVIFLCTGPHSYVQLKDARVYHMRVYTHSWQRVIREALVEVEVENEKGKGHD